MRSKLLALAITTLMIVGLACGQQVAESSVGLVITPIEEAGTYLGEEITTCGEVIDTRYHIFKKGRPTYLYLDKEFPFHELAVVVMAEDRDKFPGEVEIIYKGEYICVVGEVRGYSDQPEIMITSPVQLEVRTGSNAAQLR